MIVNTKSNMAINTLSMNISNLKLEWQSKSILIVGAGVTGLACAEFLRNHGIDFKIVDSRNVATIEQYSENVIYGNFQKHLFDSTDILIVSPGISIQHTLIQTAINQGKEIIGDVELFCRLATKPIIAITGSNGKSTVTTLVGNILKSLNIRTGIGGNIGVPCLELLKHDDKLACYVLELSSFQLETTESLSAIASVILNLSEDHMDRYNSYAEYCNAKKKILTNAENIIVNLDDIAAVNISNDTFSNKITFSLSNKSADCYISCEANKEIVVFNHQKIFDLSNIKIIGQHNKLNILAALCLCSVFDLDLKKAADVINQFSGLDHRSQVVSHFKNVLWVNDSKATNIGATSAALSGLIDNTIHLILGGQSKGQDFTELSASLTSNIKEIVVYGEDAETIINALQNKTDIVIHQVNTLEAAVFNISQNININDVVLFSPACASFDQFDNYMQRGKHFSECIKGLEL